MPRQRSIYSTAGRTGGRNRSTNAQFAQDVQTRLYGDRTGTTIPRVAAARSAGVPAQVAYETNRLGGRNALRTSPNGTMTAHEARYNEIRAAMGLSVG
jgi:hypothetical protein